MEHINQDGPVDIFNCEREPIHIPGSIQPIGHLIVIDQDSKIVACNQTLLSLLEKDFHSTAGHSVYSVMPFLKGVDLDSCQTRLVKVTLKDLVFYLRLIDIEGGLRGLEFLPFSHDLSMNDHRLMNTMLDEISRARAFDSWGRSVVTAVQELLGYDRVMLYRFDQDCNGEIIEEVIAPSQLGKLEPYKGLHYPAGDIPPQARLLYKKKLSRVIADMGYSPDPLMSAGTVIDLTYSNLRSVSPIHLEYLSNMGVSATFVLSIMVHDELWGLIACHHQTPKNISLSEQNMAETIIILASRVLQSIIESDKVIQEKQAVLICKKIFETPPETPLERIMRQNEKELLALVGADSVLVQINNQLHCELGKVPARDKMMGLIHRIKDKFLTNDIYSNNYLALEFPEFLSDKDFASGVLAMKLLGPAGAATQDSSYIFWFRREVQQTISWGGNPNEKLVINPSTGRLSPRGSFNLWKEITTAKSLEWTSEDHTKGLIFRNFFLDFIATQTALKKRQVEELYLQSQRVIDLGRMAATVAHDFNNILQGIVGALDLHGTEIPKPFQEKVEIFADRGKAIVRSLLSYARAKKEDYESIPVEGFCDDVLTLGQVLLPKSIRLIKEVKLSPLDVIYGSKQELFQTLVNIMVNAKDAIGSREGKITLRCSRSGDNIIFAIQDTGVGISPQNISKIFDPFFTTKSEQKGTGLGLSYIKQIVDSHCGSITVDSRPGEGTTFTLSLPAGPAAFRPQKPSPKNEAPMEKSLKSLNLLYIEDDLDLLETNELLFGRIFHSVTGFSNASEALQAFLKDQEKFQMVICDLRMPGMDGIEFYRRLRESNTLVPFALMSGELELSELIANLPLKENIIMLPKPCKTAELIGRISEKI